MGEEIPELPPAIDPDKDYRVYVDAWEAGSGTAFECDGNYLGSFNDVVHGDVLAFFLNDVPPSPPSPENGSRQCNVFYYLIDVVGHPYCKQRVIAIIEEV